MRVAYLVSQVFQLLRFLNVDVGNTALEEVDGYFAHLLLLDPFSDEGDELVHCYSISLSFAIPFILDLLINLIKALASTLEPLMPTKLTSFLTSFVMTNPV